MNLPWDIIVDILIRLPLKSIARFRCVNHSWYNQLKCPKFLKARNDYAIYAVEMGKFNLMFHDQNDIYTFNYDATLFTCEKTSHIVYPSRSICPGIFKNGGIEVVGCCNGLVLLLRHVTRSYLSSITHVLILWNPTTNEYKRLPNPPNYKSPEDCGFGYDEQIKDFKVVHFTKSLGQDGFSELHLYTLKSNSWRTLCSFSVYWLYSSRISDIDRSPVNGCFHWITRLKQQADFLHGPFILRFKFETDEFDTLALPDFAEDAQVSLCCLGGSLCCFCDDTDVIDVWELKEKEDKESWTKLFTIDLGKHFGEVSSFMPLSFLKNGKIVLSLDLSDGCLHIILYDPKYLAFETIAVHDQSVKASAYSGYVYVESLFSLGTGTYLGKAVTS